MDIKKVTISIKGRPVATDREDAGFELVTDGDYTHENGHTAFSYVETELTGTSGLITTIGVEPDCVVLMRGDSEDATMLFTENSKNFFLYDTPYGSITMGIVTHYIKKDLDDEGGSLEIRYDLEVDNVAVSRNLFQAKIKVI